MKVRVPMAHGLTGDSLDDVKKRRPCINDQPFRMS